MKKLSAILLVLSVLLFSACAATQEPIDVSDLSCAYIDLEAIQIPKTAKTYAFAGEQTFTEEQLFSTFEMDEQVEKTASATGYSYWGEIYSIYGACTPTDNPVLHGLILQQDGFREVPKEISIMREYVPRQSEFFLDPEGEALSFCTKEDAAAVVQNILQKLGAGDSLRVTQVKGYLEEAKAEGLPQGVYAIAINQFIDDIPMLKYINFRRSTYWTGDGGFGNVSAAEVFYGITPERGKAELIKANISMPILIGEELSEDAILSPKEALKSISDFFAGGNPAYVLDAQFGYFTDPELLPDKIAPAYHFVVGREEEFDDRKLDGSVETSQLTCYYGYVVDAVSGKCLSYNRERGYRTEGEIR